ncbi:hypothetical protein KM800_13795 [Clostridium tyrobutyricum]|uniref:hypothetical protein n=1 Tax=Clostridium tyrobutyricum TaxID=1519 RepID=UPI001C38C6BB|nr:hypothetical protein [Clostridium tyrobutyricum]MBV4420379.1 hypothetical protein [Clostridium tyrobutyricum]
MNKKFKLRILSLITVLSISSITFAGCSFAKAQNSDSSSSKSSSTAKVTTKQDKKSSTPTSTSVSNQIKNDTAKQNQYYLSDFKMVLNKLASSKAITSSQESAILNVFNKQKITSENFEAQLDTLTKGKVITQSQKLKILDSFKANNKVSKAPIDKNNSTNKDKLQHNNSKTTSNKNVNQKSKNK